MSREEENERFYHGLLPSEDTDKLLMREGDFLVRAVELQRNGGRKQLYLSVRGPDKIYEFVINRRPEGYAIDDHPFATLAELLAHYRSRQQPLSRKDRVVLIQGIERQQWELRQRDIVVNEKIGSGAYGFVYKGTLRRPGGNIDIAIKRFDASESQSCETIDSLMKEARVMQRYDHPNVVKFFGVVADRQPVMLVMELAPGGSLDNYLKRKSATIGPAARTDMALQAARGLKYLHAQGCIHRDIAARNCLLSHNSTLKISDFGLSRPTVTYKIDLSKPLNVRWLAPEAWTTAETNRQTDVYAYGVLLWEIFHKPYKMPYDGWPAATVKRKVIEGFRPTLPPTDEMPPEVAILTNSCWGRDPAARPSFRRIVQKLE